MKNTTTTTTTAQPTLALRTHSIRNLTAAELRVAVGGDLTSVFTLSRRTK